MPNYKNDTMKTNQLMKRELDGAQVTQRTLDGFFNATEIAQHFNADKKTKKGIDDFFNNKGTKEFLEVLANELNSNTHKSRYLEKDLYTTKRGVGGGTYMHPYLFIKFAMWLSPKFEVKVIRWVHDNLIFFRNEAGDHYTEMTKAIKEKYEEFYKGSKPDPLIFIKEANFLKVLAFGYKEKPRNEATENELKLLNALQLANINLINEGLTKQQRQEQLRNFAKLFSIQLQ